MTTEYISVAEAKRRAENLRNHVHMERVAEESIRFYEQMSQEDREWFRRHLPQNKVPGATTLNWDTPSAKPGVLNWDEPTAQPATLNWD